VSEPLEAKICPMHEAMLPSAMSSRSSQIDMFVPQLALEPVAQDHTSAPLGELSLRQQELLLRRQLVKSRRRGDLVEQAACYLRLGDIQLTRGDTELAGDLYRQALKLSQTAHDQRQATARSK
jgi:hypothetical protein